MWMTDQTSQLAVWLNVLYLLCRYVHLIAAMLLVGGFLFYEMVVPMAIADLKEQAQLAVFAQARWTFRWITWGSIVAVIVTGSYMTVFRMQTYIESEFIPSPVDVVQRDTIPWALRTGWWWAAHVLSAGVAILVALHLVSGDRPPTSPVSWLRLDLMLLLIVIFFATVTRQVDQIHYQRAINLISPTMRPLIQYPRDTDANEETDAVEKQPEVVPVQP